MASSFEKLKDLELSRAEVDRIGHAFKDPKFRKMFHDYVEELQDPANQKLYESEVVQLEKERGIDVTFIHPKAGFVVKTSLNGSGKVFVNICSNELVGKPTSKVEVQEGVKGLKWALPHTLSPQREDLDNKGVKCVVFDVVFHPDTIHMALNNDRFKDMVILTACEGVERNFNVDLDKKNLKFPRINYKGVAKPAVIRKESKTKPELSKEDQEFYDKIYKEIDEGHKTPKTTRDQPKEEDKTEYTTPSYQIKQRQHLDIQDFTGSRHAKLSAAIPKELIVEINLPLLKSANDITLDVADKQVQLTSEKPAKYKLNLKLPYSVDESTGQAKFDKSKKVLLLTLPVKPSIIQEPVISNSNTTEDSGVESDQNRSSTPEPEEEEPSPTPSFLDPKLHYNIPEHTCNSFENTLALTLHVKNIDENSMKHTLTPNSLHLKFTSISPSFYPSHYSFYIQLPTPNFTHQTELWDNNLIVQLTLKEPLTSYQIGVNNSALTTYYLQEPELINKKQTESTNSIIPKPDTLPQTLSPQPSSQPIDITPSSDESSGDELSSYSPSTSKGILKHLTIKKRMVGRSISESSLDDFISSSIETGPNSLDSVIPEETVGSCGEKKHVRFNDAIMKQLYRSNCSILGQRKKNQRKSRNKKRAQERRYSESETSEHEDKKERDLKTLTDEEQRDNTSSSKPSILHKAPSKKEDFTNILQFEMDH